MKISIAIGLTPPYRKIGAELFDTQMPGCEQYVLWSDEYLACHARTYTATLYHPVGTARMGPAKDPRSVVDHRLRVLGGVSGLRVADGSIMPEIVSGNTNAPIIMIGEKCADIIKEEYGQQSPPDDPLAELRLVDAQLESGVTDTDFVEKMVRQAIDQGKRRRRRKRQAMERRTRKRLQRPQQNDTEEDPPSTGFYSSFYDKIPSQSTAHAGNRGARN